MPAPKGNTNGKQFVKGQRANPNGRPPLSALERSVRMSTRRDIAEALEKFQQMSLKDIQKFCKDSNNVAFQIGIGAAYMHYIKTGDFTKLDKIYSRVLGSSLQNVKLDLDVDGKLEHTHTTKEDIKDALKELDKEVSRASNTKAKKAPIARKRAKPKKL